MCHVCVMNGGFTKHTCCKNCDFDSLPTLFSALNPAYRAVKAKETVGSFSHTPVQEGEECSALICRQSKCQAKERNGRHR